MGQKIKDNRLMVRVDADMLKKIDRHRREMFVRHGIDMSQADAIRALTLIGLDKYDGTGDRKR